MKLLYDNVNCTIMFLFYFACGMIIIFIQFFLQFVFDIFDLKKDSFTPHFIWGKIILRPLYDNSSLKIWQAGNTILDYLQHRVLKKLPNFKFMQAIKEI